MPAALPGMCVRRWTLLEVASGGSAGRSAAAGPANATANSTASHLVALPPTAGPLPTSCRFHGLPFVSWATIPEKEDAHEVPAADSPGHDADAARPRRLGSAARG